MRFRSLLLIFLGAAAILTAPVTPAANAASVAAVPAGKGVWVLNGSGLSDVAGILIVVTYNTSLLGTPTVTQGPSLPAGMFIANTTTEPGKIRIAWISTTPITADSGNLATVSFAKYSGAGTAGVNPPSLTITDSKLNSQAGEGTVSTTTEPSSGGTGTTDNSAGSGSGGGGGGGVGTGTGSGNITGGTVTMPSSPFGEEPKTAPAPIPQPEQQQIPALPPAAEPTRAPESEERKSEPAKQPEAPKKQERKYVKEPSVLDSFRAYKGEQTLPALAALFSAKSEIFRQEPQVVLTDGAATAKVWMKIPSDSAEAPNFAFRGAHFVSMSKSDDEWLIEVMPDKNAVAPVVMVAYGASEMEIPVIAAPPVDLRKIMKKQPITDAEFQLFRKEKGTDKAPLFDLNGDGRRDYIDDYIFVANYLSLSAPPKAPEKKALQK
jgi:hypothetical protein